ncbi:sepiapterin reductase b [Eucyclogobius newberryi]|uniref:sepiapterin reductase b n=1 Tax=Eucyclogobius newberryi TaxID=166745 RepID=UPI003B5AAF40
MCDINSKNLGRCLCIITGASKGFGRSLALQVPPILQAGSVLFLVARTGSLLQDLKTELEKLVVSQGVVVQCVAADLSTVEGVTETLQAARQESVNDFDHVLLINNAASLGDISQFSAFTDPAEVNSYISFNVSSALALTAGVLQAFPQRPGLRRTVVNVSSVFAHEPLPRWVLYCTAKAARYMMFKVLAKEEPDVKVLSYSPGPMDTEMQVEIFKQTGIRRKLMPCQEPGAKLLKLVLDSDFSSGAHLDYFDL